MSILFVGTEGDALENIGAALYSASAGRFDADASRVALRSAEMDHWRTPIFSRGSSRWAHFAMYYEGTVNPAADSDVVTVVDSTTGNEILRLKALNAETYFQYHNGSAWVDISGILPFSDDTLYQIDIECDVDGSTGSFALYIDGVKNAELTGNTDFRSGAQADKILFWNQNHSTSSSQYTVYFTEVIVADEPTVNWRLVTLWPDGNGNHTAWTGDYTDIDEAEYDTADQVDTTTAAQRESFTIRDIPTVFADLDVAAVVVAALAKRGTTGPQDLQIMVRTNSLDFDSSSVGLSNVAYERFQNVWATNPDTSAAWTQAEVNALEIGVESIT